MTTCKSTLLTLIGGLVSLTVSTAYAAPTAKMYSTEGKVEDRRSGQSGWVVAAKDETFAAGDAVRTGDGSRAAYVNAEGILVRLGANSMVEFKDEAGAVSVEQGDAHFLSRDPHTSPSVTTSIVSGSVRGTEFAVHVEKDEVTFAVLSGEVALKNEFGGVTLTSGEEGVTKRGQAPTKRILVRPFDSVQWTLRYPALVSLADFKPFFDAGSSAHSAAFAELLKGDALKRDYQKLEGAFNGNTSRDLLGRSILAWLSRGVPEATSVLDPSFRSGAKGVEPALTIFRSGLALEGGDVTYAKELHAGLTAAALPQSLRSVLLSQQAVIAIAQNDKESSARYAAEATAASPEGSQALFARSLVQQSQSGVEAAEESIRLALKQDPENASLNARLAELRFAQGYAAEGEDLARKALDINPDDADARSILGFIYLARSEIPEARAAFTQSLASRAPPASAHLGLGITTIREGDKEGGRAEIQKAVQLEPTNSLYRSYLGKALFEANHQKTSEEELQTAMRLDPSDPTPHLYDAFGKLATFRPIEALSAVEDSIALNDNRFVFRSKLLLDQDRATRAVGLGRVFTALDFLQPVRIEALKALAEDPSNYSAHLLLKDSLIDSDSNSASVVEDVTAGLLAPSTFSSILATASGAGTLNEYTTLFEQLQSRTVFDVVGQSKQKGFDASAFHFAGGDRYSYLLGYSTSYLDGYRNNDFQRRHNTRFVSAYDLTPDDKVLVESINTFTDLGDTFVGLDPKANDSDLDISRKDIFARLGYRHTFSTNSKIIGQAAYVDRHFDINDSNVTKGIGIQEVDGEQVLGSTNDSAIFDIRNKYRTHGFRGDMQHLWNSEYVSAVSGGGFVSFSESQDNSSFAPVDETGSLTDLTLASRSDKDARAVRGYSYLTFKPSGWVRFSAGSNYSRISRAGSIGDPFVDQDLTKTRWNPRVGMIAYPTSTLTVRSAYFEQLGGSSARDLETLEPTQISGIRTVFDDPVGARSRNLGVGVDWKAPKSTYLGTEFIGRRVASSGLSTLDILSIDQSGNGTFDILAEDQTFYSTERVARAYLHQVVTKELVASIDYDWTQHLEELSELQTRTHRARFGVNYFHPSGFFSFGSATWRGQERDNFATANGDTSSDFWIASGGIGWQLPNRHGSVQLAVRNILDRDFTYAPVSSDPQLYPGTDFILSGSVNL